MDAIDLVPVLASSTNVQSDRKSATSPSRVSNTMEHQMQINIDPKLPRGEPQLVGLTRLRYDSSKLQIETQANQPIQNYYIESAKFFFPDKPNSKRVTQMRQHAKNLALSQNLFQVTINLPFKMLIEQINLTTDSVSKKQSEFSKNYQLISAIGQKNEIFLKSAYSECVTRNSKIEYNLCGVTQSLTLVFVKDNSVVQSPITTDQIQIKIQQAADIDLEDRVLAGGVKYGITTDDEDDDRILDSLPITSKKAQNTTSNSIPSKEPLFHKFLQFIEIVGFNMQAVPAITNLTYFMNQQFQLLSKGQESEAHQVEFMIGQLLVTTKRATQAVEVYRKMQIRSLNVAQQTTKQNLVSQNTDKIRYKWLIECAVYELLIADSLSPNLNMNDKILSINRLACFLRGQEPSDMKLRFPPQVTVTKVDQFSSMLQNLPDCLRFSIACLSHKIEIVRISALKMLKYMLETLGCSLDYGMVFILKSMLKTYPSDNQNDKQLYDQEDFNLKLLLGVDISIIEYLFKQKGGQKTTTVNQPTQIQSQDEPQSGSKRAMTNIYNHVLDTFISVLSSVSSHILHSIFYDVIEPTLQIDSGFPVEVRLFTCKIADKIFTICQGDLLLTPKLLDTLLALTSNQKAQLPDSIENTAQTQIKNLWQSIRQKVLPNYSTKGFQSLVNWLVKKLTDLKNTENADDRIRQMAEIITIVSVGRQKNEEDANQLIRLPSYERYGGGPSSELYLVLAPLLYWLEYSIDREERFPLFHQLYQTIKDVLAGLPKGQSDLDIASIMLPQLQRASDFMAGNSPNLSMLKFLDLVLTDLLRHYQKNSRSQPPLDIQQFFHQMLSNFVAYISYSLYEEVLFVFEKLISLCSDVISEKVICACIVGLIDKYTMKSKQLKNTVSMFMKFLLNTNSNKNGQKQAQSSPVSQRTEGIEEMLSEGGGLDHSLTKSNYFEIMADFCFFSNPYAGGNIGMGRQRPNTVTLKQLEFRSAQDIHDLCIEKIIFFIESLALMNETHITVFTNLITHPNFRNSLMNLIDNGESQVRLKAHEIMESLTQYFVQYCPSKTVYEFTNGTNQNEMMDAEFISHERLYISQIVIQVAKVSLERTNDCYLQFNSLILLDFLFQNLLPVPTFQNEQLKTKRNGAKSPPTDSNEVEMLDEITMDVEILSISESTPELDVMDPAYLRMRMKLVFSLWPHIQQALNSPWSNIRSICYGLICSMLKIDVNDYPKEESEKMIAQHLSYEDSDHIHASQSGLSQIVLPMLYSLLASKESESKAGGLNILGSFCGLSYDFTSVKIHKHLAFFQRNSKFVSYQIWKLVFGLQDDWDITIKEASVVLVQLCAPRNAINYFQNLKEKKEKGKLEYMLKMQKASDIYTKNGSIKDLTKSQSDCAVNSEHARRAIALFPTNKDCKAVLESSVLSGDGSDHQNGNEVTFQSFMFSRRTSFPMEMLQNTQILQMSDVLAQLINDFNPNFEDKRLTKVQQPMSRRRQIEIELNLNGRGKEAANKDADIDPNYFVDAYSDDQIQEIISIFRNDFKPPKNLWIEKQPNQYVAQNYGHHGQPAVSQSPDFFQDIYSEAIDQFNQHQMMMQQRQQDELQQQVSSGHSLSQSSISSSDSVNNITENKSLTEQVLHEKSDSQNSSTPSPPIVQSNKSDDQSINNQKKFIPPAISSQILPVTGLPGSSWPTSPVLVSSTSSDKSKLHPTSGFTLPSAANSKVQEKKNSLQVEQINFDDIANNDVNIKPKVQNELENLQNTTSNRGQQDQQENTKLTKTQNTNLYNQEAAQKKDQLNFQENDYQLQMKGPDQQQLNEKHQFSKTQRFHGEKFNTTGADTSSNLLADLNLANIKNQQQHSPKFNSKKQTQHRESLDNYSGSGGGVIANNNSGGDQKISRKNAHTYLSNLNQGYIQNIDGMKLINTCLSQQQMMSVTADQKQTNSLLNLQLFSGQNKKLNIKTTSENQPNNNNSYGSTSQKNKKPNASNSPENDTTLSTGILNDPRSRKSSKINKKISSKEKQPITHSGTSIKQMNNLADLNFFIKTIEKDLVKNMKVNENGSSFPATPKTIIKKVEDQMRALGVDPKLWNNPAGGHKSEQEMRKANKPANLKLLALNQIVKHEDNQTPSSQSYQNSGGNQNSLKLNQSSSHKLAFGGRSHDSDSDFCKTQRLDKKATLLQGSLNATEKLKTHRNESDSRERDNQSSGRGGASNNSAGKSYNYPLLSQPAILTDRSSSNGQNLLGFSNQGLLGVKQSNSTRYDSTQPFQFKKGNSKSQSKTKTTGYSALASKSMLSPTLKRDQQSGGLIQGKINISMNQIQPQKTVASSNGALKKSKVSFNSKGNILQDVSTVSGSAPEVATIKNQAAASFIRQPQSTRNMEQGDRKQFSPESVSVGKPPLKKKKVGHSHTNSTNIAKPGLVLQQPSYF